METDKTPDTISSNTNDSWADLCEEELPQTKNQEEEPKEEWTKTSYRKIYHISPKDFTSANAHVHDANIERLKQEKLELHSILNCFQSGSRDGGYFIHIGDKLRDPRYHNVRDYLEEVKEDTFCLKDARRSIGYFQDELTPECRNHFVRLMGILDKVRVRLQDVLKNE